MARKIVGYRSHHLRMLMESLEQRLLLTAYTLHQVAVLNANDRGGIYGIAVDQQGDVLGTSAIAGTSGGTFFKIPAGASAETALSALAYDGGDWPGAKLLQDSAGNIYASDDNGIYKVAPGSGIVSTVALFSQSSGFPTGLGTGARSGLVMDSSGNLYGVFNGGDFDVGGIYEVAAGTDTPVMIASFASTGYNPIMGLVIDSSGNLYGGTSGDGNNGFIYELSKGSNQITTLVTFDGDQLNIGWPLALDPSGNLYGVARASNGQEWVYELPVGSHTPVEIASFEGAFTDGGLSIDAQGDILGVAESGDSNKVGSVFEITPGSGSMTTIGTIPGLDPAQSMDSLAPDGHGDFYGVSYEGVVYELVPVPQLAFDNAPVGSVSAGEVVPPLSVSVDDSFGQIDTTNQSQITLTVSTDSGSAVATYTANAENGIATFSGITMSTAGGYQLTASGESLASAEQSLVVNPNQLVFSNTQLGTLSAGQALPTFSVNVENAQGEVDTTNNGVITLTITSISGNVVDTATAVNGVAVFSGITMPTAGGCLLTVSEDGALAGEQSVVVTPGAASQMVFYNQPANAVAGQSLGSIEVAVLDAFGNFVVSDNSTVTLSLAGHGVVSVSAGVEASGALEGALTAQAQQGLAIFSSAIWIGAAGTYTLEASDGALPVAASSAVTIASNPEPGVPTAIATFDDTDGAGPEGGVVIDGKGNMYGLTLAGGSDRLGTVFEIAAGSGVIQTLASFTGDNGSTPVGGLTMDGHGNLYGTTTTGGAAGNGVIFMLAKGSHTLKTLVSFNGSDGIDPRGNLAIDGSGNLFGITEGGGAANDGTVFELAKGGHAVKTLVSFDGANGEFPFAGLSLDKQGNLYGVTRGADDGSVASTVFEIVKGKHPLKALASSGTGDGWAPWGPLVMDSAGNLYGVMEKGGANGAGTVFEVVKNSGALTVLASFDADRFGPEGGLVIDAYGDLFGSYSDTLSTTSSGGLFEVKAGSGAITVLAQNDGSVSGRYPAGSLTMGKDGTLYGAAFRGGATGDGVIFSFTPPAPVPPAAKLVVEQQPGSVKDGVVSLKVGVLDAKGKVITGGAFSLTLVLEKGPGVTAEDFSVITVETVDGVGTFSDVSLPAVAGTYRFAVSEGGLKAVVARGVVVKKGVVRGVGR